MSIEEVNFLHEVGDGDFPLELKCDDGFFGLPYDKITIHTTSRNDICIEAHDGHLEIIRGPDVKEFLSHYPSKTNGAGQKYYRWRFYIEKRGWYETQGWFDVEGYGMDGNGNNELMKSKNKRPILSTLKMANQ